MSYPPYTQQSGPGLTNSYAYGQSGLNSPLYANNYNPNAQYTYGQPFANNGLQGMGLNNSQPAIQSQGYQSPYYSNPYQQVAPGTGSNVSSAYANMHSRQNLGELEGSMPEGISGAKIAGGIQTGLQTVQTVADIAQDFNQASKFDVDKNIKYQQYHPRSAPPVYMSNETPQEISKGTGGRAALKYAGQGAAAGATIGSFFGGPLGTAIGAGVGALGGAVVGAFKGRAAKRKRNEFLKKEEERRANYTSALGRYYDIQNQSRLQGARQQQMNQRGGGNLTPAYNASIYGIGNY